MTVLADTVNTPEAWSERALAETPWDAAGWSERGQTVRFRAALDRLDLRPGDSLLDFGCGPGRLRAWLPDHVEYVGVDWSPGMVARASATNPDSRIHTTLPDRRFDHTVALGTFNLRDGWTKTRTRDEVAELWLEHTSRTLVLSVYRGDDPGCIRYTPRELAWFVEYVECDDFEIIGSHLPNDLLLVLRRPVEDTAAEVRRLRADTDALKATLRGCSGAFDCGCPA